MFTVEVNTDSLEAALSGLGNAGEMRLNVMRALGGVLMEAIERASGKNATP